jgi:hypothetical protein
MGFSGFAIYESTAISISITDVCGNAKFHLPG